jgi:hypothetical protein
MTYFRQGLLRRSKGSGVAYLRQSLKDKFLKKVTGIALNKSG